MTTLAKAKERLREVWEPGSFYDPAEISAAWSVFEGIVMAGVEVMPSTFHRHTPACWTTEPVDKTMAAGSGRVPAVQCAVLGSWFEASEVLR